MIASRSKLLKTFAVITLILALAAWGWYQPVRYSVLNATDQELLLREQHSSVHIPASAEVDIGIPRRFMFQIGAEPMIGSIRFKNDGSVEYRVISQVVSRDEVAIPPEAWAHHHLLWREFRLRYDKSGELALIPPDKVMTSTAQPAGFPICLDRINLNMQNSGLTSPCSRLSLP